MGGASDRALLSAPATGPHNGGTGALGLLLGASLRQIRRRLGSLREQSGWLTALIVVFLGGYLGLAFWLFWRGLRFISNFPGLGGVLVERLLFLLFAFLFALLLFSNLVIGYTQMFRNRETIFLLVLPVDPRTIFQWKFLESTLLASWAFVFLIAPLLVALGLTYRVAWHFYLATPLYLGLYLVLPAVLGAWSALLLARFLDRRGFQILALGLMLVVIGGIAWWLKPEPVSEEMLELRVLHVLDRLLVKTQVAQYPWLPSYWVASGIMLWSEGALRAAVLYGLVLLSYVLMFGGLACTATGRAFFAAVSAEQSRGRSGIRWWKRGVEGGRSTKVELVEGFWEQMMRPFFWLRPDVKALVVKDIRIFWRDTTQWGQTLVLFGLLGVYILNLRHFSHQMSSPFWVGLISYLNLFACALNLATLTTRFVFPQFSLEGKRLWIIGLAPLGLRRILTIKLRLATTASLALTGALTWLSCHMLRLPEERTLYFVGAVAVMAITLNRLAVGLGTMYPNFKEDNPSKIVSGFGGTCCLVLSFLYLLGSVIWLAYWSPWSMEGGFRGKHLAVGAGGFGLWSWAMAALPWHLGMRQLQAGNLWAQDTGDPRDQRLKA